MHDQFFMERCEALAAIAAQRQESPVGSLVVVDGDIIGEGIEAGKVSSIVRCHSL